MLRLLIVRHGETDANARHELQGQMDPPLNARGLEQAERVAERLRAETLDGVYASDLLRARQTAEAIARRHGITIELNTLLRERSYGVLEGMPISEYVTLFTASGLPRDRFTPEGGESYHDLVARLGIFTEQLLHTRQRGTFALVAHGGANRALLKVLLDRPIEEAFGFRQDNTGVTEVIVHPNRRGELVYLNCTAHV